MIEHRRPKAGVSLDSPPGSPKGLFTGEVLLIGAYPVKWAHFLGSKL